MKLDKWQEDVLACKGNICICSGRQVGKSTVISMRAGLSAVQNKKTQILVIAAVERQAYLLFEKILAYLHENHKKMIKKGKDRPTKTTLKLTNGSVIRCLPTGQSGYGIRGFTIDDLYADEAHFIPEDVWAAVTPMLATTGGRQNLLSTPDLTKGKSGYFYRCTSDPDFTYFSISSPEVAENREEPQRSDMLGHYAKERKRLSKRKFAAEYLGQFVDAMSQFFPNDWIEKVCCIQKENIVWGVGKNFLGVDIAGMGKDESTFEVLKDMGKVATQVLHETTTKTRTTETTQKILHLEKQWKFKKIGVDDGGMGVGVFDQLLRENSTRRKVVALNNASRSIERDGRRKRLLKEDMYNNLLVMGERGELKLYDNDEIKQSLRSICVDLEEDKFRLTGSYSHITEGLIRAAWLYKEKGLNIWIA
jgi:hypothetical protein